ncbi:hypothetical protein SO802_027167 [Lithocarpus litseifolius]|uniref:Reverse transcriptase zinc-binding domain-containing protein n=1 Tax=Lithocarpus litseifolius TaxID=425828 RepID=A0AAW2C3N5_9ROSI
MCYKLVRKSSTDVCTFCGCPYETALHIFIKCPFTIYVWANLLLPIELENLLVSSIKSLIIGLRCPAKFFKLEVEEAADGAVKKRVEDVMPIATRHEREELEAEL